MTDQEDQKQEQSDTTVEAVQTPGRTFISDGETLTLLEEVPWNSLRLRSVLAVALDDERLVSGGAFAIMPGRHAGGYTARRIATLPPNAPVVLRVALWEGHWVAVGPAGTEPREVFHDGRSQPWYGPVPVEALA